MKTQLAIRVRKEGLISKGYGKPYLGPFALFGKRPVILSIDGHEQKLLPQKEPHMIDIVPGTHTIDFIDPQRKWKKFEKNVSKATFSAIGLAAGGVSGGLIGGMAMGKAFGSVSDAFFVGENGNLEVNIKEGDIIRLTCKAKANGTVSVDLDH